MEPYQVDKALKGPSPEDDILIEEWKAQGKLHVLEGVSAVFIVGPAVRKDTKSKISLSLSLSLHIYIYIYYSIYIYIYIYVHTYSSIYV